MYCHNGCWLVGNLQGMVDRKTADMPCRQSIPSEILALGFLQRSGLGGLGLGGDQQVEGLILRFSVIFPVVNVLMGCGTVTPLDVPSPKHKCNLLLTFPACLWAACLGWGRPNWCTYSEYWQYDGEQQTIPTIPLRINMFGCANVDQMLF